MHVIIAVLLFVLSSHTYADTKTDTPYYFGVINQRSISLTAKYWNPILAYISNKTDVPLRLIITVSDRVCIFRLQFLGTLGKNL